MTDIRKLSILEALLLEAVQDRDDQLDDLRDLLNSTEARLHHAINAIELLRKENHILKQDNFSLREDLEERCVDLATEIKRCNAAEEALDAR